MLERLFARRARSARNWLFAWTFCLLLPCWLSYFPFWINTLIVVGLMAVFGIGLYVRSRPWWERKPFDEDTADAMQSKLG